MVHQKKKVVEEVSGWLRIHDDGSVDRTWTGPPEVKFMAEPVPPHEEFKEGVAVRDVTVDEKSGLKVRIYLPQLEPDYTDNNHNKLPIIVHFHGGGFCVTQADWYMYYHIYSRLARSAPAIVVSVYLRLAPEHRLPAAMDDGFSALVWLRSLGRGHGSYEPWLDDYGDFNRVFLVGDSSGGNVVHQVAARAGLVDLSPVRLAGGIPIHPGFVRSVRSKSEMEQPESPFLTLDMVDSFLKLALPEGCTKDHPFTRPGGLAAPPLDGLNLPPFLLCVAESDLMMDTQMEYCEAMKEASKDLELLISPGVGHSFYLNKIAVDMDPHTAAQTTALIDGIIEFIKKH
uniref:Alpha/beta hydrolase fold-3 domain-containing protein n=1 Tax=Salix viminalis TaxID=40686 RepID=A0A6N2K5A8_SALVM